MIASIEGTVTQIFEDSVVINVNGIGFKVFVPSLTCQKAEINKYFGLHTFLVVREDALILYGFETLEEKDLFILLLGANGVGPRTALSIISTLSIDIITNAVIQEQPEIFNRVSGVGKKTAQSIVLQLQGKLRKDLISSSIGNRDIDTDVIAALTGLGYSIVEAQSALQMIPKDAENDLETKIKLALQYFS